MSSILDQIPPIEIEGNFYKYRRLGILDIPRMLDIVTTLTTEGFEHLNIRLQFLREMSMLDQYRDPETGEFDPSKMKGIIGHLTMAFGIQEVAAKFYLFLSEILRHTDENGILKGENVTIQELSDADRFPAYSIVWLVIWLIVHPDVELFKKAVEQGQSLPFFHRVLEEVSDLSDSELKTAMTKIQTESDLSTTN